MLAGATLGAAAIQTLHAQAKPPAYLIAEFTVKDTSLFAKEYIPPGMKAIQAEGGKVIAHSDKPESFIGSPPAGQVAVVQFDSLEKAQAYWNSQARKDAFAIGEKYATFREYAIEGVSP